MGRFFSLHLPDHLLRSPILGQQYQSGSLCIKEKTQRTNGRIQGDLGVFPRRNPNFCAQKVPPWIVECDDISLVHKLGIKRWPPDRRASETGVVVFGGEEK